MGCTKSKELSVLEKYAAEASENDGEATVNPLSSPPLRSSLRLSSTNPPKSPNSLMHRMSSFSRKRGSSATEQQRKGSIPEEPIVKIPPQFLFTGRRFKKHHNSSLSEFAGVPQGRILKLMENGEIVWFKAGSCAGTPERHEAKVPDGSFSLSQIKSIEMGTPSKKSIKNQERCFSIVGVGKTLNFEAEDSGVAAQWFEALSDHLKYGELSSINLDSDLDAESLNNSIRLQKQERRASERERAYSKHSAEREKLRAARASSIGRASVYNSK
jgi:hypothetical protein